MKKQRILGTTAEKIKEAEGQLNKILPADFSEWLINNNGKDINGITVFPVFDSRDPRKTWNSIVKNYQEAWQEWLENFADSEKDFSNLLPFAEFGTGDYYCFNYEYHKENPEIVLWSHETGEIKKMFSSFTEFLSGRQS
ncbi:SMI1/KNR4 family protein [Acidovorax sp. NCPPB 4044]|uniref:SMI1/KNR4 family protein n=1 Tax=Acidovorax sp. NCPPB 4044 TaxID=2940490 RepID=UPI002304079F|nr:SMI1/KNR4 family protein [Acidovorax sp. NCPPB 4044]MDA8522180.1 SMI1/KNR4 family protein [Acidovorax sp. NCPPB 4044]